MAAPLSTSAKSGGATHSPVPPNEGDGFTRGIGIYPGDPREDFSPELVIDSVNYRNLALLRPAYHSSSYDNNLTAQLITNGIRETRLPDWVGVSVNSVGALPRHQRELVLNHSRMSPVTIFGASPSVEIGLGGNNLPEVDRVNIVVVPPIPNAQDLSFTVSVSGDGQRWEQVGFASAPKPASVEGYPKDFVRAGHLFVPSIALNRVCRSRFYRVECALANAPDHADYMQWQVGEIEFYRQDHRVQMGGPYSFTSTWMSAGPGEEWVYVDLGARCVFDRVKLYWISRAVEGSIQVSDDAESWRDLHAFPQETGLVDDVTLAPAASGRYVRVLMKRATSPHGYMLSEMEVYGRGGPVARRKTLRSSNRPGQLVGRFDLAGAPWRLLRSSLVNGDATVFSKVGFQDKDWLIATVPGTVLTSYLNLGAIPDPNYGKNQLYVSDSYFYSDFWYRTEFTPPAGDSGKLVWLNLDGINWKAEIFLNGEQLGRIEGAFMRGRFDVTGRLRSAEQNALALLIEKNATPERIL